MNKTSIFIALLLATVSVSTASAWNLKDALKGIGSQSTDSTSTGSTLGNILGGILSTDKITLDQIKGTWAYSAPAVSFRSANVLKKAGGAAASAAITEKVAPIYKRVGFDKSTLTIGADSTFTLSAGRIKMSGSISRPEEGSDANFLFKFAIAGKFNVGEVPTFITKSANGTMSVTFDATKLIKIMEAAGKLTGNSTIKTTVDLLNSYDGLCAGFEMKPSQSSK